MGNLEIIVIGLILAMDAFAVSITCGICTKDLKISQMLKAALFFGGFQAVMPFLGWIAIGIIPFDIQLFDHWIAFGLLAIIGGHMIKESFSEEEECKIDMFATKTLIVAAIATSIDALAAGFSVGLLNANIVLLIVTTGSFTFIMSIIGVNLGKKFGHLLEERIELVSGIILILLGVKILIEHLLG